MSYACAIDEFYQLGIDSGSRSVSDDSDRIRNVLDEMLAEDQQTVIKGKRQILLDSLREIYQERSEENWDGYEADPITPETYFESRNLIDLLPLYLPPPDVLPEPDGGIAFEWYRGRRKVFIISVSGKNIIHYAGLFGEIRKTHGTEYFFDSLPQVIIKNIESLYAPTF